MSFQKYIKKFAARTEGGRFFCEICKEWIEKQRWVHFKARHRFRAQVQKGGENSS
jgi:hypothetical protein